MRLSITFTDLEIDLLDSVGACPVDLEKWIDKAMPSLVKAFFKEALKKKELFDHASKKKA